MEAHDIRRAWRALGRQLAELRRAAGYTQHSLAPQTMYGRSTVANAEIGHQHPDRTFWQRCDDVLQTGGVLAAGYDRIIAGERESRRARAVAIRALPAQRFHTLDADLTKPAESVGALAGMDPSPIERRRALLAGIAAVAAASGLLRQPVTGVRVGAADVARVRAVTALYRSADYECGGGALYREVAGFAEAVSALLDGSCSGALRPAVFTAVAEARQLAGWTAFDSGRHADAQRHWLSAERAAVAAGDARLAARVRYCQARQFQHLRHNRDAVETLRLARDQLGTSTTPAITAMIDSAEAASLAALGGHDQARARLASATDAYARVEPDREPEWMSFFGHAEVLAQYGRVYRDMARHDPRYGEQAVQRTSDAIAAFGPQNVRSSVLNQVGLCSALFLAGDPDNARVVGVTVIEQARGLTSARIVDRIHNLRRDLGRHPDHPAVREFGRSLTALAATAA